MAADVGRISPPDIPEEFNFGRDVIDQRARDADKLALLWSNADGEQRCLRFSDVARLSAKLASSMESLGMRKGDRILIVLPRIPEWQIAVIACLKIGAVPIPCIEMLTAKDIEYRVAHSGARAAIIRASSNSKFAAVQNVLDVRISVGAIPGWHDFDSLLEDGCESFIPAKVMADDPAILYYTSGSTGSPKGVLHASRALFAWRWSAQYWLDLSSDDVIWCTADVGWSKAGTSILFGPWSAGSCVFFHDGPFDPHRRLELLQDNKITVYCASGTELARVLDALPQQFDLSSLRHTVTAGETLSPVIAQRWKAATGIEVAEAYGQTETLMTIINPRNQAPRPGSMGVEIPGTHVEVISSTGERLAPGVIGDLALRVPNAQIMLGYWEDPERTASCYLEGPHDRWFVTGDLAERDLDGYFYHRGRNDDIINSAGYRIGPSEVENALLEHPAVMEAAAIGAPDAERGEIVKAFIVLRPGFSGDDTLRKKLQDHVKRVTAPYKYPRAIDFCVELPKTPTGKIQRSILRDKERAI